MANNSSPAALWLHDFLDLSIPSDDRGDCLFHFALPAPNECRGALESILRHLLPDVLQVARLQHDVLDLEQLFLVEQEEAVEELVEPVATVIQSIN